MAMPVVRQVDTQGTSVRDLFMSARGSSPSSASCEIVRAAPASGCNVPWNMLSIMNQIAAALAKLPNTGANVGPSTSIKSLPIGSGPSTPSQMTGSAMKYTDAIAPDAYIARGTLRVGSRVSPTWQAAASNAGAAKPIRYRPAMSAVSRPNQPENGTV